MQQSSQKCEMVKVTNRMSKEFYEGSQDERQFQESLKLLRPQADQSGYFIFEEAGCRIYSERVYALPQYTLNLVFNVGEGKEQLGQLFRFTSNKNNLVQGMELGLEEEQLSYHIISKKFKNEQLHEDLSVKYDIGQLKQGWNNLTLIHHGPKRFTKPQLTVLINNQTKAVFTAEYPKLHHFQLEWFHNFKGIVADIYLYNDIVPDEKKLILHLTAKRQGYDIISQQQFLCHCKIQTKLYTPDIQLIYPLFYMLRVYRNSLKQVYDLFNSWIKHQRPASIDFSVVSILMIESQCEINMDIINSLSLTKQILTDQQQLDKFMLQVLWNSNIMYLLENDTTTQKSYCMILQTFYFINTKHFLDIKKVKEVIDQVIYKFDQRECCKEHYADQKQEYRYSMVQQTLVEFIGLMLEDESIEHIEYLMQNVIKSSLCLQLKILRLCNRILEKKKHESIVNKWQNISKSLMEHNVVSLLIYLIQNSICISIKSECIRLVNLISYNNEQQILFSVENKIKFFGIEKHKRQLYRRKTYANVMELAYTFRSNIRYSSGKWEVEKMHNKIQGQFEVGNIMDELIEYAHRSAQQFKLKKMTQLYTQLVEWLLDGNNRIKQFNVIYIIQHLYSISPQYFKASILASLKNIIRDNADALLNQSDILYWLVETDTALTVDLLLHSRSSPLKNKIIMLYVWARSKLVANHHDQAKSTLRAIMSLYVANFHHQTPLDLSVIPVVEELILCFDSYVRQSHNDHAHTTLVNAQMCLTFHNDQWIDADLVHRLLTTIYHQMHSFHNEADQLTFLTALYHYHIEFIRLTILIIHYDGKSWMNQLHQFMILLYCHKSTLNSDHAVTYIHKFLTKLNYPSLTKLFSSCDISQAVSKFNLNYNQLLYHFNDLINENYYQWRIAQNMNYQNNLLIINKHENQIFTYIASLIEKDDYARNLYLQLEDSILRQSRNRWKKIWNSLRLHKFYHQPPFYYKVNKYTTTTFARPFLKKKFIQPAFLTQYQSQLDQLDRSRKFKMQQQHKISILKLYLKQAENTFKHFTPESKIKQITSKMQSEYKQLRRTSTLLQQTRPSEGKKRRGSELIFRRSSFQESQQVFTNVKCMWVKSLTTRHGSLSLSNDLLIFQYEKIEQRHSHLSLKKHVLGDDRTLLKEWRTGEVEYVVPRIYILNHNAFEVYLRDGDSLYFAFSSQKEYQEVMSQLPFSKPLQLQTELWLNHEISNFEYLMQLNLLSARSYKDLTRYPVFPWVKHGDAYRDLTRPMGQMKELEMDGIKFHYGTHYSSSAILSQYMVRLEPFTQASIEIQGGSFDLPDRLFTSVSKLFQECDGRELIPEFYMLPEMFLNLNKLDLGKMQNKVLVDDVDLPTDPYRYVLDLARALEDVDISHWVDLIWGCHQRSEQAHNLFYPITYTDYVKTLDLSDPILKLAVETQVANFGQTPEQLFKNPHPKRLKNKPQTLFHKLEFKVYESQAKRQKDECQVVKLDWVAKNKLFCLRKNGMYSILRWQGQPNNQKGMPFTCTVEKEKQIKLFHYKGLNYLASEMKQYPIVCISDCKYLILGGLWDGLLIVFSIEADMPIAVHENHEGIVSSLCVDEKEEILISGSRLGECGVWEIENNRLRLKSWLKDHQDSINCLTINNKLRIFCSGSSDGVIKIYNLHNNKLLNQIEHPQGLEVHQLNIMDYGLVGIVFSSDDNDILYTYSVNGQQLHKIEESSPIKCSVVFGEWLVYSTIIGSCKISALPYFHQVKMVGSIQATSMVLSDDKQFLIMGQHSGDIVIVF